MSAASFISTAPVSERAVLVGIEWRNSIWPTERSLDELERLVESAGAECVGRLTQRLDRPVPRSFIGSGKVEELEALVERLDADVVVFDDDLTPSQQSFLEKSVGRSVKIIDRTALILDIFGLRARSREGRLQVQLAQLQYLLPRLRGMWSHLAKEQTRGGIGSRFGQGESQLEIDRRLIRDKISSLRRELKTVERRREVQSRSRSESIAFRVALAGYTNAGKSSILNALTAANVESADKLFATLDPTTRTLSLPGGRRLTITDTVGFIQKLPHGLVEAFKSTLSEVLSADLIIKVIDAADDDADRHIEAVDRVLCEIGAGERPAITLYNKVDMLDSEQRSYLQARHPDAVLFSAATSWGLESLLDRLSTEATRSDTLMSLMIPYAQGDLLNLLRTYGDVIALDYRSDGADVVARVPERIVGRIRRYEVTDR